MKAPKSDKTQKLIYHFQRAVNGEEVTAPRKGEFRLPEVVNCGNVNI